MNEPPAKASPSPFEEEGSNTHYSPGRFPAGPSAKPSLKGRGLGSFARAHRLDLRVYYEDTDAGGVMYHARYLAFAERARSEMLRDNGVPLTELQRNEGLIFVVRRLEMDYLRPARLDDLLTVASEPAHLGAATATLRQEFSTGGRILARLVVQLACVRGTDGRPARIPPRWRRAFEEVTSGPGS